jgi:DNA-binding winged helix-turn-helix (wHTH) protein/tetratricopeptide (TPR) repeat protein
MAATPDLRRGFEFGPFTIIPERGIVRRDGEDVHLEPKQMDALVTLARHQPGVVSKDLLVEEVWGGRATADESIVQCIKGIRQALDKDDPRDPKYVETIHGRGYRLMVPLKIPEPEAPEPGRMQIPKTWWIGGAAAILVLAYVWGQRDETIGSDAGIDSVVVTRFVNMSGADDQFLVDGFSEQLISTLYQVPDLRILKGNLPAEDEGPREIASRYGVDAVVSGSVQQLDDQFSIRTTVFAEDPANQCGQSFSGSVQDMFSLHEQVATKVRDCIVGVNEDTVSPASKPAGSVSYLRYLRGMSFLARRDLDSLERAAELFLESIEIDPAYGSAYLALANTYVLLADYAAQNAMFDLAVATVEEGITRDPSISEPAQTYIGYVHTKRGDWVAATESFEIATGSMTEYPPAQHYYSRLMAAVGRIDDSLAAAQAAWEMDREDQVLNSRLAIAHLWKNEMEQAQQFYDIANAMDFDAPVHLLSYALFLIIDGRIDESREALRRALTLYRSDTSWVDPVFDELARSPNSASLAAVVQEYADRNAISPRVLVAFWILAGQADRAMEMAWKLVDDPSLFEIEAIYLDEFRILRQHEDFPRFLQEIGLTDYWQSVGCEWKNDAVTCNST